MSDEQALTALIAAILYTGIVERNGTSAGASNAAVIVAREIIREVKA